MFVHGKSRKFRNHHALAGNPAHFIVKVTSNRQMEDVFSTRSDKKNRIYSSKFEQPRFATIHIRRLRSKNQQKLCAVLAAKGTTHQPIAGCPAAYRAPGSSACWSEGKFQVFGASIPPQMHASPPSLVFRVFLCGLADRRGPIARSTAQENDSGKDPGQPGKQSRPLYKNQRCSFGSQALYP